ncbi:DODA-type extradiol aromatic ring-opening family dioxygenase [Neobacillus vireti]|uniref:Extradiol ring-cleavage dioxygenase class III protein subunit B n=1 Tax=Neobacillus vireti LMG 21834 TaxID=1131730 RepID=A0AB94IU44_9BACI|nr:extradiol ring-cleavage dioxygenase class III protein subunit B [Neobacillus vireti]ETI70585.1 extradiol ring-cleavage dioxygenase class III protein subunit B [Neobacillus vireti LMG 21834]KLT15338.1 extradiol ring-cleavage dioxygenase [Neobacillus vireti]
MNPFVFACMAPHGGEIIPELQGVYPERMSVTRESMKMLTTFMSKENPDCLIILTPHGTRIHGQFAITDSERMAGTVEENQASYAMERLVDRELARMINKCALEEGIPSATINFGTVAGPISCLPLDWGVIVPLRFMPDVPIVVINPARELSFDQHLEFGKALGKAVKQSQKRVGLIASCDWAHAHDEDGPYGFDPAAKAFDEQVVDLIKTNQLEKMAQFEEGFIEAAKPDGIWQTLILAGAIPAEERHVEFLSYEAPTYFGLICAAYYSKRK